MLTIFVIWHAKTWKGNKNGKRVHSSCRDHAHLSFRPATIGMNRNLRVNIWLGSSGCGQIWGWACRSVDKCFKEKRRGSFRILIPRRDRPSSELFFHFTWWSAKGGCWTSDFCWAENVKRRIQQPQELCLCNDLSFQTLNIKQNKHNERSCYLCLDLAKKYHLLKNVSNMLRNQKKDCPKWKGKDN